MLTYIILSKEDFKTHAQETLAIITRMLPQELHTNLDTIIEDILQNDAIKNTDGEIKFDYDALLSILLKKLPDGMNEFTAESVFYKPNVDKYVENKYPFVHRKEEDFTDEDKESGTYKLLIFDSQKKDELIKEKFLRCFPHLLDIEAKKIVYQGHYDTLAGRIEKLTKKLNAKNIEAQQKQVLEQELKNVREQVFEYREELWNSQFKDGLKTEGFFSESYIKYKETGVKPTPPEPTKPEETKLEESTTTKSEPQPKPVKPDESEPKSETFKTEPKSKPTEPKPKEETGVKPTPPEPTKPEETKLEESTTTKSEPQPKPVKPDESEPKSEPFKPESKSKTDESKPTLWEKISNFWNKIPTWKKVLSLIPIVGWLFFAIKYNVDKNKIPELLSEQRQMKRQTERASHITPNIQQSNAEARESRQNKQQKVAKTSNQRAENSQSLNTDRTVNQILSPPMIVQPPTTQVAPIKLPEEDKEVSLEITKEQLIANKAAVAARLKPFLENTKYENRAESLLDKSINNMPDNRKYSLSTALARGDEKKSPIMVNKLNEFIANGLNKLYQEGVDYGSLLTVNAEYMALNCHFRDTGLFDEEQKVEIDHNAEFFKITRKEQFQAAGSSPAVGPDGKQVG